MNFRNNVVRFQKGEEEGEKCFQKGEEKYSRVRRSNSNKGEEVYATEYWVEVFQERSRSTTEFVEVHLPSQSSFCLFR